MLALFDVCVCALTYGVSENSKTNLCVLVRCLSIKQTTLSHYVFFEEQ
jgi:hypothetical protein